MAETVVQMRDVTKRYRRDAFELKVLRGITLDVWMSRKATSWP